MKLLLIDNETHIRRGLRDLILAVSEERPQIEEADGVQTGLRAIRDFAPDVVLLDIEMEDGTGFDLLRQLPSVPFQLIFTTAFDQYAIQAFKFSAIDYLMKFGYTDIQAYMILGTAPVEGRLSGVVDIPNACSTISATSWIPTRPTRPTCDRTR